MANAVRVGFPITMIWWVCALQATVGRMTSISYFGNVQTGYYGAGTSFSLLLAMVPNAIGRVFYPRINAQIGKNAALEDIRQSVIRPAHAIAFILPFLQVVIFYLMPVVYNDLLPKYKDGLVCAQILILGCFFAGLIRNGANFLIAADMQMRLMKYVLISLVATAAGSVAVAVAGAGIAGLAVATSLASGLLASLIWHRVFRELKYDRQERLAAMGKFYLSFVCTLVAIGIVSLGFAPFSGYSRVLLPLKMLMCLVVGALIIMSFASGREQMNEMCRRMFSVITYRFRQPALR